MDPDPLKSISIILQALNHVLKQAGYSWKNHLVLQKPFTDIYKMSQTQPFLSLKPMRCNRAVHCRAHWTCFSIWKSLGMHLYNSAVNSVCEQAHPMLWQLQGSGQEWLPLSSETHRWRKLFTAFFLMGFHGWLTFKLNFFASYFAYSCYSTFLSLLDPASPWIFDAKLKHCKPRDKFYPGCSPRRA